MKNLRFALWLFSLLGFIYGLLAHAVTYLNIFLDDNRLFFRSAFIVFAGAIFFTYKTYGNTNRLEILKKTMKGIPLELLVLFGCIFLYDMVVANLRIASFGVPTFIDYQYVMENNGLIVKIITQGEYEHLMANKVSADIAVPHIIHALAFLLLYPMKNQPQAVADTEPEKATGHPSLELKNNS